MKILILDHAAPATTHSGKSVRLLNLFKRLGRRHALHYRSIVGAQEAQQVPAWMAELVVSSGTWPHRQEESAPGRCANWLALQPYFYAPWRYPADYRRLMDQVRQAVRQLGIDVVHCFDGEVAQFIPRGAPWIFDPADAMALHAARRLQTARGASEWLVLRSAAWRLARYERQLVSRAQASVFVSEVDAACYATNAARRSRIRVITNGVDTAYFDPQALPMPRAAEPMVLFTGHMSFGPNDHAAHALLDEIMPAVRRQVPEAVCALVGAEPTPALLRRHDGRQTLVTGRVDDLRPYFQQATVYACPMRLGAGIKNKLLEAMAMGCAIVSTSSGAAGLRVKDGAQLLVRDASNALSDAVVQLMRDAALRRRLGEAARAYVAQCHSWDHVADQYDTLYTALVEEHKE